MTDEDIGGVRGALVFINRVGPDGMMIVPVGEKERDTIVSESTSLVEQLETGARVSIAIVGLRSPRQYRGPAAVRL